MNLKINQVILSSLREIKKRINASDTWRTASKYEHKHNECNRSKHKEVEIHEQICCKSIRPIRNTEGNPSTQKERTLDSNMSPYNKMKYTDKGNCISIFHIEHNAFLFVTLFA